MAKLDNLVKPTRTGSPNGFDTVTDTYEFDELYPNGEVTKVVITYRPATGYETTVHIKDKIPNPSSYPDNNWGQAKADLDEALRQNGCRIFNIPDPR
jgi:hypothetical protein